MKAVWKAVGLGTRYVAAVMALVVFLFPLYWTVATALKPEDDILTYPPVWWPRAVELSNFSALFEGETGVAILNSLVVATVSTALAMVLGTVGGYALAKSGPAGRLLAGWGMAARLAPPVAIALPFVLLLDGVSWAEGLAALVFILTALNLP